jgi:hypothetical protein
MTDTTQRGRSALSRLQTLSLLAAPLTAILARLLWVPYEEADETTQYIADLGKQPTRADVGVFLMMLSALLFVPATFTLAGIVCHRMPRAARIATAMTVIGAFGMAVLCSVALVATHLARQPDQAAMADLWEGFFNDSKGEFVFLAVVVGVVGYLLLAVGLYRSSDVPKLAAVLVGLGAAATLFTSGGPARPLLVTAAVLALAGFGWVAAAVRGRIGASAPRPSRAAAIGFTAAIVLLLGAAVLVSPIRRAAAQAESAASTEIPTSSEGAAASTESPAGSTERHLVVGAWLLVEAEDPDSPPSLIAFTSDGIYQQADFDGINGYGSWESTGPSSAAMTFIQQFPDDEGNFGGSAMIRAAIEVSPDGQSLTANYTIEMGAGGGVPAGEYGPGAVSGTRIAVEPMGTPVGPIEELFAGFGEGTEAAPPTTS